jgi:hypothetical protein
VIIDHPTQRIDTRLTHPFHEEPAKVVQCDFCRSLAPRAGSDIEGAAEAAFRSGWKLVRGKLLTDPKKWSCGCA